MLESNRNIGMFNLYNSLLMLGVKPITELAMPLLKGYLLKNTAKLSKSVLETLTSSIMVSPLNATNLADVFPISIIRFTVLTYLTMQRYRFLFILRTECLKRFLRFPQRVGKCVMA